MDLQGSLVDTKLRIYPSNNLLNYFKTLEVDNDVPLNILKFIKGKKYEINQKEDSKVTKTIPINLSSKDIDNLNKIIATVNIEEHESKYVEDKSEDEITKTAVTNSSEMSPKKGNDFSDSKKSKDDYNEKEKKSSDCTNEKNKKDNANEKAKKSKEDCNEQDEHSDTENNLHLITSDIDWLYDHLQTLRNNGSKNIPYLHDLLEGADVAIPDNKVIKRNPVLEARCVKLRAQQEAREYRKMTKSVDNVRMRFPEDSISYQLKQVNRQLIAIGQFIISIFAGFLFGFKGLEWMIGPLDFGFRLLMGVMCALIIALAEIYFLAKKLNEELNVPETVQLGGPPKFVNEDAYYNNMPKTTSKALEKDHQD